MSSSKPKITAAACPKCKQRFKFNRVPEMASVVCPHCGVKIGLTRTKKKSAQAKPTQVEADPQSDNPPTQPKKLSRLPVPGIQPSGSSPSDQTPDDTPPTAAETSGVADVNPRRGRVDLTGFQIDDLDRPKVAKDEEQEPDGFPQIKTGRTRKRVDLNKVELGETDEAPFDIIAEAENIVSVVHDSPVRLPEVPEPAAKPPEIKTRRVRKRFKLDEGQVDASDPPKAPAKPDAVPQRRSPNASQAKADPKGKPSKAPQGKAEPSADSPKTNKRSARTTNKPVEAKTPVEPKITPSLQQPSEPRVVPERRQPSGAESAVDPAKVAEVTKGKSHSTPADSGFLKPSATEIVNDQDGPKPITGDSGVQPKRSPTTPVEENPKDPADQPADSTDLSDQTDQEEPAEDLLPPKFLVADIESDQNAVVLPAADGGTQVVDKSEIRVTHGGKSVTLLVLTPEERARARLIENSVALVIAAIMLAIAVWLVL